MTLPRPFRYTVACCGLIMLAGAFLAALWVAPLCFRQNVAWRTVLPLWTAALVTVLEAALVIGTPLGVALTAVRAGRATRESAESPVLRIGWRDVLLSLGIWCAIGATMGAAASRYLGAPGNVVRGVIAGALEDCRQQSGRMSAAIPLIGARWICPESQPANLAGEVWRGKTLLKYTTRGVSISEDLASVELSHLDLLVPRSSKRAAMHLSVERARLHGAWPWARRTRLSDLSRALYVSVIASGFGAVIWGMSRRRDTGYGHIVIAAFGATLGWLLLRWVDAHESWSSGAYIVAPLGALFTTIVLERVAGSVRGHALRYGCLAQLSSARMVLRAWCRRMFQSSP